MTFVDDLRLARRLQRRADTIALAGRQRHYEIWTKSDGSSVTEVDVAVEEELVSVLRRECPADRVLSEECGETGGDGERRWILDPIDGTFDYLHGKRSWGTHVALEDAVGVCVAVVSRPTEQAVWWATRGGGAFVSRPGTRSRLRTSRREEPGNMRAVGHLLDGSPIPEMLAQVGMTWGGDDIYALGALLDGRVEVFVEEGGKPWDRAPGILLATEAGGGHFVADGADDSLAASTWWLTNRAVDPVLDAALRRS